MNKSLVFGLAAIGVIGCVPVIALADENTPHPPPMPPGAVQYRESALEFRQAASSTLGQGTSTPPMPGDHGKKLGIIKHFGTTTPPGFVHREATSSNEQGEASSTKQEGQGPHFGVPQFLQWLFGHPASTTLGDIKTEIAASSTPAAPPGFLHKLFSWFGF